MFKKTKRIITFILILSLIITNFISTLVVSATEVTPETTSVAKPSTQEERANVLKELGLFAGTNNGFELDRAPTRAEALIMMIRMIGKAEEAKNSPNTHPFTDVPEWANSYISYAYNNKYTSGISSTEFGTENLATIGQFSIFMLRALGHNDREDGFDMNAEINNAGLYRILGTTKHVINDSNFYRGDCIDIIYSTLQATKKNDKITMAEYLINNGTIKREVVEKYNIVKLPPKTGPMVDLSSNNFTNNTRVAVLSQKSLHHDNAMIMILVGAHDSEIKAKNIYISKDGVNYELLEISPVTDFSNDEVPYVIDNTISSYSIVNLNFDTEYTVCVELKDNVFVEPVTIKTVSDKAQKISGFGAPFMSNSPDGKVLSFKVGINISLNGDWSYQFYTWVPGSKPVAIKGASGTSNGSTNVFYEPKIEDLNKYVFWRVTNADGVVLENYGWFIDRYNGGVPPPYKR